MKAWHSQPTSWMISCFATSDTAAPCAKFLQNDCATEMDIVSEKGFDKFQFEIDDFFVSGCEEIMTLWFRLCFQSTTIWHGLSCVAVDLLPDT